MNKIDPGRIFLLHGKARSGRRHARLGALHIFLQFYAFPISIVISIGEMLQAEDDSR
jgi:hypothetical protein